jgi:epoxyqueuosine reductase
MPAQATPGLKERLREEAFRLGFELFGVTTPEPPRHLQIYEEWLARGMHGEMKYLAASHSLQKRRDPRRILPQCRSILVLGTPYPHTAIPDAEAASRPRLAAYALGRDYHDVLVQRMGKLIALVEQHTGAPVAHRIYTDSGPLLERELGQRAGLGWIGKNTCLISPQHGSFFFLSEILLQAELEPDEPAESEHCGTCTRCIEACPTQCIQPDRTLDARRCISYLTIESRSLAPPALRSAIGAWLFGCDVCQIVCPWNMRFARPTADPAFAPLPALRQPNLLRYLLGLDTETYAADLHASPLRRAKREGLVRNACLVAGNSGDETLLPELARVLTRQAHPLPRAAAAWALGQLGTQQALQVLQQASRSECQDEVRREIAAALAAC